ncbi:MAG TPA: histone [Candidatus Woesearchaeota archaeon]|nr:histone [Candidatus Woesearchaeota archaeon]
MPKNKTLVPLAQLRKVAWEKEFRISKPATEELRAELEAYASKVIKEAIKIAKVSGKKTVQEKDVDLAIKLVKNEARQ